MNILLVSDDHGMPAFESAYLQAVDNYGRIDAVIHAGDSEKSDESYYKKICNCPVYLVKGNNDYNNCSDEIITVLGGKKFFITHGHKHGIYSGIEKLYYTALEKEANVVVFGHTHKAKHLEAKDLLMINPGSLTLPRGGMDGSYAVLVIDDAGKVSFKHYLVQ